MSIGEDIAEVFAEVGTPCEIIKANGSIIPAYFDVETNPFHSTTFIRQNCINSIFPYDTDIEHGDVVKFTGRYALVMNAPPELFQGAMVVKNCYLVNCNTSTGMIYRKQIDRTDYRASADWGFALFEDVCALHYAGTIDAPIELVEDVARIEKEKHTLFLPAHLDIRVGDRWLLTPSSKPYQISAFTDRRYEGLHLCTIIKDEGE